MADTVVVPEQHCICAEIDEISSGNLTEEQVTDICCLHWERLAAATKSCGGTGRCILGVKAKPDYTDFWVDGE